MYQDLTNSIYAGSGGDSVGGITASSSDTLTNKTINYNDNTITNLPGAFVATDQTGDYTAVSGDWVIYDLSAATVSSTLTLPATPAQGDTLQITLGVQNTSSAITVDIARNGSSINGGTAAEFELAQTLWKSGDTVTFTATGASAWATTERSVANRFAASVHRNGVTQTNLTTSTAVQVVWTTEAYDYNNNFASNVYTVPISGIYSIQGLIGFTGITVASQRYIGYLRKNGSNIATQDNWATSVTTSGPSRSMSIQESFVAGDTIDMAAYTTHSGNSADIGGNQNYTNFQISLIGSSGGGGGGGFVSTGDALTLTDTTQSVSKDTGTLIVEGGVGIEKNTYIGGDLNVTGTITGTVSAAADSLNSATTVIDVSSATAPTTGQVLTATSATTATWQTASGGSGGFARLALRSGSTTFTNTTFTGTYKRIECTFDELACGSTGSFRIRMSGNNGVGWSTYFTLTSSHSSTGGTDGKITIDACEATTGNRLIHSVWAEGTNTVGVSNVTTGAIDAIEFSNSGGSITGGTITIVAWT